MSVLRASYLFLVLSILCAVGAGWWAMRDPAAVAFCRSPGGWVFMLVTINATPYLARWAASKSTPLGLAMLALDGALSGVALCPLLFVAQARVPGAIEMAGLLTLASWGIVSACVFLAPRDSFPVRASLLGGMGAVLFCAVLLNGLLFHLAFLHLALSVAVGVFGVLILVYATAELKNKDVDDGVEGALILFAGLFNVFVSILQVLVAVGRSSRTTR